MVCRERHPNDGEFYYGKYSKSICPYCSHRLQCATKSVILHLQWQERPPSDSPTPSEPSTPLTATATKSPLAPTRSLIQSRPGTSLNTPRRASGPLPSLTSRQSLSPRVSKPSALTKHEEAPPQLLAVIETPDVAVGAVDPRKRRVATSTRFSSRLGADRRVCASRLRIRLCV
jgi:pyrimidine and pyridine-specific 5'-nucleotidase